MHQGLRTLDPIARSWTLQLPEMWAARLFNLERGGIAALFLLCAAVVCVYIGQYREKMGWENYELEVAN